MVIDLTVKEEETEGGSVFDDDTIDRPLQESNDASAAPINEANLIELPLEKASKLKFPVGCPVWYYDKHSPQSTQSNHFEVRHGTIISALMDFMIRKIYFRVEKTRHINDLSDAGDVLPLIDIVLEDKIVYAATCPVLLQMGGDKSEMEGEIVCPRSMASNDGSVTTTYTVMIFLEGNKLRIEDGVEPRRIKFHNRKGVVVSREEIDTEQVEVLDGRGSNNNKEAAMNVSLNENHSDQQTGISSLSDSSGQANQKEDEVGIMGLKHFQSTTTEAAHQAGEKILEKKISSCDPLPQGKRNFTSMQSTGDDVNENPKKIARKRGPRRRGGKGRAAKNIVGGAANRIPRKQFPNTEGRASSNNGTDRDDQNVGNDTRSVTRHVLLENLPLDLSEAKLYTFLRGYSIVDVSFPFDAEDKFLGYAIVELQSPNDAAKVVQEKDGAVIAGHHIAVDYCPGEQGQEDSLKCRNNAQRSVGKVQLDNAKKLEPVRPKPTGCTRLFIGNLLPNAEDAIKNFFIRLGIDLKDFDWPTHDDGSKKP